MLRYIQTVSEYHAGRCAKSLERPILRHRRAWVLSGQRPYTQKLCVSTDKEMSATQRERLTFRYSLRKRVFWGVLFALFAMLVPLFALGFLQGNAWRSFTGLLVTAYLGFRFIESLTRYVLDHEGISQITLLKNRRVAWSEIVRMEERYRRNRPVETALIDAAEHTLLKLDHAVIESDVLLDEVDTRLVHVGGSL